MMKILQSIIILLSISAVAQTKEIEVTSSQIGQSIIIAIKNNTNERKEVTLTVTGFGYKNFKNPITKLVNQKEKIDFVTLQLEENQPYNYSTSCTFISKPTDNEIALKNKKIDQEMKNSNLDISLHTKEEVALKNQKIDQKTKNSNTDISSGIVVFTKDGCPRCNLTITYLLDNNIDFKILNTTKDIKSNQLMWQKLNEINVTKDILMPIIIVNGKLTHTHIELKVFLETLK